MQSKKLITAASTLALVVVISISIGMLAGSTAGLSAELIVSQANIGIPGISKMYQARLVNHGFWPVRVSRCDFVDDTLSAGKTIAYAVQRWDTTTNQWTAVVEASAAGFCKPYPLGIVRANLTTALLWPGQSLSTGEEATAARDRFNIGDRSRFVIFTGTSGDYSMAVATGEFVIDQHPKVDVPLRVGH